jgi:glycosyltransferase involved in cell wall biosynthesis
MTSLSITQKLTVNDEISEAVAKLKGFAEAPTLTRPQVQSVSDILDRYFGDFCRSRAFRGTELTLLRRFDEMLSFFDHNEGVIFANKCFLFCYTLTLNYKQVQTSIHDFLALPYQRWAQQKWQFLKPVVAEITSGDEYVFVCRHAVTKGGYAPGSSTFTFAKALLKQGYKVTIISLGNVTSEFVSLTERYTNLKLFRLRPALPETKLLAILKFLKLIKPRCVLTEIEFDIVSVISILKPSVPIIYLSPGYYNLPWFDKIGLTDNLSVDPVGARILDFFEIPTYIATEILNPPVDIKILSNAKNTFAITDQNFLIGSFARMEKFQPPFLAVLNKVLERCSHVKVLLAGPNDRSLVTQSLNKFISTNRAFVLPSSDVHILGHCLNLGIDTFPTHSGFSVLELMAKGVPVVAKRDAEMDALWRQRLPELMRPNDEDLVDLICSLASNSSLLNKLSNKTKTFLESDNNDQSFISALDKALQDCLGSSGAVGKQIVI